MLLHRHGHLLYSLILLQLALLSEDGFGPEHGGKQLGILPDSLKLLVDVLLELSGVLQFRDVEVFIFIVFVLGISQLRLELNLMRFKVLDGLQFVLNVHVLCLNLSLQLLNLGLLIELVFRIIVLILAKELLS